MHMDSKSMAVWGGNQESEVAIVEKKCVQPEGAGLQKGRGRVLVTGNGRFNTLDTICVACWF